ncbi:MAG: hypothetical protein EI684_15260 [Candidatus Viridilinea halotolerans]|uniref:Uncharacterized protein n=1 Tax=Candidatus Viridilinea halotolerans TaxID=2491704 RepID=A0A426TVV5_9CHLR|nr:MAG: hypothetical protein EI684_15260 [Candidatus Viridilinea halotolerans]
MDRIALLHTRLPITTLGLLGILLVWGLIEIARGRLSASFLAMIWVAQWLLSAQFLLGLMLLVGNVRRLDLALHVIYGVITVSFMPAALVYFRERVGRRAALHVVGCVVVLLVLLVRAVATV